VHARRTQASTPARSRPIAQAPAQGARARGTARARAWSTSMVHGDGEVVEVWRIIFLACPL